MVKLKVFIFTVLSRVANSSFKSLLNRVISLNILAFLIYRVLIIMNIDITGYWSLMIPFILVLSLSVKRISNNFLFSRFTKHASMIIKDTTDYRKFSYIDEKENISNLLKDEFIEGLINSSNISTKVRFSTHKWFVENVVLTEKIKEIYNIDVVECGETSLALEVLTLIKWNEIMKLNPEIINSVFKKRKAYKVKLNRIKK